MGLDMYLTKHTFIGNNYDDDPKEQTQVIVKPPKSKPKFSMTTDEDLKKIKQERVSYIIENVGYWRKANAIHNWIVNNVAEGVDDCKEVYLTGDDIKSLLDTVNKVLEASELVEGEITNGYTYENGERKPIKEQGKYIKDASKAQELLPTGEGFFFGSTEYDQWYYQDLLETKKILEACIAEEGDYYYHASW